MLDYAFSLHLPAHAYYVHIVHYGRASPFTASFSGNFSDGDQHTHTYVPTRIWRRSRITWRVTFEPMLCIMAMWSFSNSRLHGALKSPKGACLLGVFHDHFPRLMRVHTLCTEVCTAIYYQDIGSTRQGVHMCQLHSEFAARRESSSPIDLRLLSHARHRGAALPGLPMATICPAWRPIPMGSIIEKFLLPYYYSGLTWQAPCISHPPTAVIGRSSVGALELLGGHRASRTQDDFSQFPRRAVRIGDTAHLLTRVRAVRCTDPGGIVGTPQPLWGEPVALWFIGGEACKAALLGFPFSVLPCCFPDLYAVCCSPLRSISRPRLSPSDLHQSMDTLTTARMTTA